MASPCFAQAGHNPVQAVPATIADAGVGALLAGCMAHSTGQITLDSDAPVNMDATPVKIANLKDAPRWLPKADPSMGKPTLAKLESKQGVVWIVAHSLNRQCTVFVENDEALAVPKAILGHVQGPGVPWVKQVTANGYAPGTTEYVWQYSDKIGFELTVTAPDDPGAVTVVTMQAVDRN
jgi:hypothetical protein